MKLRGIGRPIANTQVYLLDRNRQLVPIGAPGELYIGGDGLALDYLNRPELNSEKFVPHPFAVGQVLYRTGDKARWRPDGGLEFLGRLDDQVKLRGHRIELSEVASVLAAHPAVAECVVSVPPASFGRTDARCSLGSATGQPDNAHVPSRICRDTIARLHGARGFHGT